MSKYLYIKIFRYSTFYKDIRYGATFIESANLQQVTLKYKNVLQSVSHLEH